MSENPSVNKQVKNMCSFSYYDEHFQAKRTLIDGRKDYKTRLNQINRQEAAFNDQVDNNHTRGAIERIAEQADMYCEEIQELYDHFEKECALLGSNDRQLMLLSVKLRNMNLLVKEQATKLLRKTIKEVIDLHTIKPARNPTTRFHKSQISICFLLMCFLFFLSLVYMNL